MAIKPVKGLVKGKGYTLLVRLPKYMQRAVDQLGCKGRRLGRTRADTIEYIISSLAESAKGERFLERAFTSGYCPVKFDPKIVPQNEPIERPQQPFSRLRIELYGLPAFFVDRLADKEYGGRKDKAIRDILLSWMQQRQLVPAH